MAEALVAMAEAEVVAASAITAPREKQGDHLVALDLSQVCAWFKEWQPHHAVLAHSLTCTLCSQREAKQ